jgi:hypothetical protein
MPSTGDVVRIILLASLALKAIRRDKSARRRILGVAGEA